MFDTDPMVTDAVMPFVICRSLGGPHDDEAFFSGWRLAELAAMLGRSDVGALAAAAGSNAGRGVRGNDGGGSSQWGESWKYDLHRGWRACSGEPDSRVGELF